MVQSTTLVLGLLAVCAHLSFATPIAALALQERSNGTIVHLRIELEKYTLYDGPITTGPRSVTTPSGGTHHCECPTLSFSRAYWDNKRYYFTGDGTNHWIFPTPGPTCTSALADLPIYHRLNGMATYVLCWNASVGCPAHELLTWVMLCSTGLAWMTT